MNAEGVSATPDRHVGHPEGFIGEPQMSHLSLASQAGHRFQCGLTFAPHIGHDGDRRGYSQAGQMFQEFCTGSLHLGQTFFWGSAWGWFPSGL
jgi:hypothetical protein